MNLVTCPKSLLMTFTADILARDLKYNQCILLNLRDFSSFDKMLVHLKLQRPWYTQKNVIKSKPNQIVFTIFQLIWNQTDFRLENGNLELGFFF